VVKHFQIMNIHSEQLTLKFC